MPRAQAATNSTADEIRVDDQAVRPEHREADGSWTRRDAAGSVAQAARLERPAPVRGSRRRQQAVPSDCTIPISCDDLRRQPSVHGAGRRLAGRPAVALDHRDGNATVTLGRGVRRRGSTRPPERRRSVRRSRAARWSRTNRSRPCSSRSSATVDSTAGSRSVSCPRSRRPSRDRGRSTSIAAPCIASTSAPRLPPSPATPPCAECPARQGRRRHRRAPRARAG